jgi:hypothetical protein
MRLAFSPTEFRKDGFRNMDDNDTLRQILGFFAMMVGTLMDPIALPCYIASGLFIKKLGGALAASIGFSVAFRIVIAAIRSNAEGGAESGSPDFEIVAASFVGAAFVTSIVFLLLPASYFSLLPCTGSRSRYKRRKMTGSRMPSIRLGFTATFLN